MRGPALNSGYLALDSVKRDVKTTVKHCGKQNRIQRTCECEHGTRVCVCVNKILEHCCRCCNITGKLISVDNRRGTEDRKSLKYLVS